MASPANISGSRIALGLGIALILSGCAIFDKEESSVTNPIVEQYRCIAESVEYADPETSGNRPAPTLGMGRPLIEPKSEDRRPIALQEAIKIGLQNNEIIRQNAQFLSPGNPVLANPEAAPSIYDPAIQEKNVLYGNRGLDGALSDFDPRFTLNMPFGRSEVVQNNGLLSGGLPPGSTLVQNTGQFQARLEQQLLTGGTFALNHNWLYNRNNQPFQLFESSYAGSLGAEFRQPLWAGAGQEFNSIAGPLTQRARGFSYVNQGIVISQINDRVNRLDLEDRLQNLVRDIGEVYWETYLAWQDYIAEREAATSTQRLWEFAKDKFASGLVGVVDEAQAEDGLYEAKARRDQALSVFFQNEARLRRLLGLPIDDPQILFPSDAPIEAEVILSRDACLQEAFTHRVELRKQKTQVQSLELQLCAARNLVNPRLDFVSGYRLNGFGDNLLDDRNADNITTDGYNSAYGSLFRNKQTSWDLGLEYTIPLWLRSERAQVRQLELRIAKARSALSAQEEEIAHELNSVFQNMQRWMNAAQTNRLRQQAAKRRLDAAIDEYKQAERTAIDPVLRARISFTQAQVAYARSIAEYNKAIRELQYRIGSLLHEDGIIFHGIEEPSKSQPHAHPLPPDVPYLPPVQEKDEPVAPRSASLPRSEDSPLSFLDFDAVPAPPKK